MVRRVLELELDQEMYVRITCTAQLFRASSNVFSFTTFFEQFKACERSIHACGLNMKIDRFRAVVLEQCRSSKMCFWLDETVQRERNVQKFVKRSHLRGG